jgi:hypothetical protein
MKLITRLTKIRTKLRYENVKEINKSPRPSNGRVPFD